MRFPVTITRLLIIVVLMAAVPIALAGSSVAERIANQQSLRSSVESGEGKFARLKAADRMRILRAQDTIFALLKGKSATSELSRSDVARIDSAETEIATLVASLDPPAAKAKVVCSYEARIGSNRKERVCRQIGSSNSAQAREQVRRMQTR